MRRRLSVECICTSELGLFSHNLSLLVDLFVNLVAAGEIGGILDTILNRLATYIEKNVKLARQVKGAIIYPIAICLVAAGVVTALLIVESRSSSP